MFLTEAYLLFDVPQEWANRDSSNAAEIQIVTHLLPSFTRTKPIAAVAAIATAAIPTDSLVRIILQNPMSSPRSELWMMDVTQAGGAKIY